MGRCYLEPGVSRLGCSFRHTLRNCPQSHCQLTPRLITLRRRGEAEDCSRSDAAFQPVVRSNMRSALAAFVACPSRENFLSAREEFLGSSPRLLTPADLDGLSLLADAGDALGLTQALGHLPPIAALVPRV